MNLWTVVLAGGEGRRLWPLSTARRPKQLVSLDGQESLLSATVARAPSPPERVLVVTAARLRDAVVRDLATPPPGRDPVPHDQVIAEPSARHTGPAVALGVFEAAARGATHVVVLPADHHVHDPVAYTDALRRAVEVSAQHDALSLLGAVPTAPHTGFGWIEVEGTWGDGPRQVLGFHEKPSLPLAEHWLEGRRHLVNVGVFCGAVEHFQDAFARHLPGCSRVVEQGAGDGAWPASEPIGFDRGVLERETALWVVPLRAGWDDLGTWEAWMSASHGLHGRRARVAQYATIGAAQHDVWAPKHRVVVAGDTRLRVVLQDDVLVVSPVTHWSDALRQALEPLEEAAGAEAITEAKPRLSDPSSGGARRRRPKGKL